MAGDQASRSLAEPHLSPEQREWLGLGPDDSVRLLASGSRTIVLERSGGDASAALPWDRDLVLSADVRAFSLADVLHLLHASAKSGFLFFENASHAKSVYMHRGEVVFAASNQPVDRLGESLLREGVITPEQFRDARRLYSPDDHYGKVLVERGYLTPRELWNGVKAQVEEIVRSLFSYGAGFVFFWEGEVRPDNVVRLSLPTRRLIAEGLARRDELLTFVAWLEDSRVRFEAVCGDNLNGTERTLFEAAGAEDRFRAICRRAGVDPLTGARTLQMLRLLGAIKVERSDGPAIDRTATGSGRGDRRAIRDCVWTHVRLLSELAAPIVALEGAVGLRERLVTVAEEGSRRFPELLSDLVVDASGSLDPDSLVERALRFPGDREREVRLALGELVSYLEFELVNHPRIEDPDGFLEGIEELRASL